MTTIECPRCKGTGKVPSRKKLRELDGCAIVTSRRCQDPDPEDQKAKALPECFSCGQPVCRFCSVVRQYQGFGRRRICDTCEDDLEGNDRKSLARRHREASYERCREKTCEHNGHVTDDYGRRWGG